MRLFGDYVLVLRDASENKTDSGIIIPDQSVKKKNTGVVINVGPGTDDAPMTVKVDDSIAFAPHAGSSIMINDVEHLLMRVSDIYYVK